MRTITILITVLAVLVGAAEASAKTLRFNVSVYGVQRYTNTQTENDVDATDCFGARGTTISRSVVKFHTARPVHVKATRSGSYVNFQWPDSDLDIPVVADWEHSGESNREERQCVGSMGDGWIPDPLPIANNCHKTLTDHGYSLSMSGGKVEVTGGRSMAVTLDPFHGCPWGDMSLELYPAKARVRAAVIMDGMESELTLRGREHSHTDNPNGSGSSDTVKQTTVYVVFKRR
jgi:hypothetical protein